MALQLTTRQLLLQYGEREFERRRKEDAAKVALRYGQDDQREVTCPDLTSTRPQWPERAAAQ